MTTTFSTAFMEILDAAVAKVIDAQLQPLKEKIKNLEEEVEQLQFEMEHIDDKVIYNIENYDFSQVFRTDMIFEDSDFAVAVKEVLLDCFR